MPKSLRSLLPFLALPLAPMGAQTVTDARLPYVETTGRAERRVSPDRALVMINVMSRAMSASAAAAENARIQQRVMDTLRVLGLGNAAVTGSYNVGLDWEPDPATGRPGRSRYAARASIHVRVTDISTIGRIIDATLAKGATGVDGIQFESSQAQATRRAAMADAASAARADAEALASALGGSLGRLVSVTTVQDPRYAMADMRLSSVAMGNVGGAEATSVIPNQIVIAAVVLTRWEFVAR